MRWGAVEASAVHDQGDDNNGSAKGVQRDESVRRPTKGKPTPDELASARGPPARAAFPIVGLGASAGGIEALSQLLEALPLDTGMAFVVVQHLDPDHKSQLTQILSRSTTLPVSDVSDEEPIEPNHVYVIRRDTTLTLLDGAFHSQPRGRVPGVHRSIDHFFESLAVDRRERAVGVVLSGTASDGTLGLEAIKAEGGITFAQDASAQHASMPRSAVAAGCVDLVLSPVEIAQELARIAKHPYVAGQAFRLSDQDRVVAEDDAGRASAQHPAPAPGAQSPDGSATASEFRKVHLLLRNHSGVDFSCYKSSTIQRRITRRLVLSKHDTLAAYASFLRGNTAELDALYSDVLISVTSFFRNPETFEVLREKVLPQLLASPGDDALRCWVLGCSTGQEAYSIAMGFIEAADTAPRLRKLTIFATDLNEALLEKARHGLYAKSLVEDVSPERLARFFTLEEGGYRVRKSLREMVIFARHNLTSDPPFSRMDLISCRNVLIYLESSLQKKALPTFHYALKPTGCLLLGASESIGGFGDLFEAMDKKHKLYSKKPGPSSPLPLVVKRDQAADGWGTRLSPKRDATDLQDKLRSESDATREADRIALHQFAPPSVLVNAELQVLQFRGPTGAFLEPPVGKASFDVLKMAREGLMLPLRSAIQQAKRENRTVRREQVQVKENGSSRSVSVEVVPLKNLREQCFLIFFEQDEARGGRETAKSKSKLAAPAAAVPEKSTTPGRVSELETELGEMRDYLSSMRDQHEASSEEVQSANEEVQSANEELQSINEELETSKEELESANEELTTVNEEMSNRNIELNRLNSDLVNLQDSTKVAVVLFGADLTIRRFSPQAEKQFDLLASDAGRPIGHLHHGLFEVEQTSDDAAGSALRSASSPTGTVALLDHDTPLDLEGLVARVVSDVREQEREVRDRAGRWYSLRIRPYLTAETKVDGAVLVLVDVDQLKQSEQANGRLAAIVANSSDAIASTTLGGVITSWNGGAEKLFGFSQAETIGHHISLIVPGDLRAEEEEATARLARGEHLAPFETERQHKAGQRIDVSLTVSPIRDAKGRVVGIARTSRDITERKTADRMLRESEERHRTLVDQVSDYAIFRMDDRGYPTTWNRGVKRVLGFDRHEFLGQDISKIIFTPEDYRRGIPQRELDEATLVGSAASDRWMRRRDGQHFFASGTTTALRENGEDAAGFAKVMRDQTTRIQAEEASRASDERLHQYTTDQSEVNVRKNEFLAMLGHELRNPLAALSHGLDLLGRVSSDHARSEELRRMMTRQTTRIATLLDQLLDIARVTSGKVELSKEEVDLAQAIRMGIETIQPLLVEREHELVVQLSGRHPLVIGDAVRLAEIVENLLTNAAKYTSKGGRIEVVLEAEEETARITVRDNGSGMSADLLPHVFEIFTQAPRLLDRASGGLGLGLALVQQLVQLHGGQVIAESPGPGRGSAFIVTLPCTYSKDRVRVQERTGAAPQPPHEVRRRRILIVDDETDAAEILAELLRRQGHETHTVHDGLAALEAVRTFGAEVVLLDLGLPLLDGYEVAMRLRQEYAERTMLLIAVTGYGSDSARLTRAGFDHHLIKPLDLRLLTGHLAELDAAERRAASGEMASDHAASQHAASQHAASPIGSEPAD